MEWDRIKSKLEELLTINPLVSYKGDFTTFEEASNHCTGYDSEAIFTRVQQSILAVKNGEACYERDGCLFYEREINYHLLMYLYKAAAENQGESKLLDWGGSLGSTYFQHRALLQNTKFNCSWTVIEQKHFVEFGHKELEDNILHFYHIPKDSSMIPECNIVLLSGVLQYIPDYYAVLHMLCEKQIPYIIIERTPMGNRERIWIETVKEPIYNASYPCRMIEENQLMMFMKDREYSLVDSWKSQIDRNIYLGSDKAVFKSLIFQREYL